MTRAGPLNVGEWHTTLVRVDAVCCGTHPDHDKRSVCNTIGKRDGNGGTDDDLQGREGRYGGTWSHRTGRSEQIRG